jgi:hypothetical protein
MEQLGNVAASYISLHFGIVLGILAMMLVYTPVCIGVATVLAKVLPYKVRNHSIYGYTLATLMGVGGIWFMVLAVNFFKL